MRYYSVARSTNMDAKTIKEGRYQVIEQRAREYLAAVAKARAPVPELQVS